MGVAALIRRLVSDRATALALMLTIACSLTLLAAGPMYADAVTAGALRKAMTDAPVSDTAVIVETRLETPRFAEIDKLVESRLAAVVADIGGRTLRSVLVDDPYALVLADDGDRRGLAEFEWIEGISERATIVDGAWPAADPAVVEVAIDQRTAMALDLTVGREIDLPAQSTGGEVVTVRIAGRYEIDEPADLVWQRRPVLLDGLRESQLFRTVRFLTTPEQAADLGSAGRISVSWTLIPSLDRLEPDEVAPTRRRVSALASRLNDAVEPELSVETNLPSLLRANDRSLTVTRSAVVAVTAQLTVLAVYALVLVAGLSVDARVTESAQFRARGASAAQLFALTIAEAVLLVVPAALLAPTFASWALRAFDEFGPLASIGLTIEPRPNGTARIVVGFAALALVIVLAIPAWRAARAAEHAGKHRRQSSRSTVQRAGIDLAVVTLAIAAYWQLATLGDERAASIRGRFGVDPLLIVAPTFGLLAGALIMLRAIPPLARMSERVIIRSRSIVSALPAWQLARRPVRYSRAGLMLTTAIAIGAFAVSYEATWSRSQVDQAHHEVGTDARVAPNRRTGDSLADLHLVRGHEMLAGVERSVPVLRGEATLPGSDRQGVMIAIDAGRAQLSGGRSDDEVMAALARLAAQRPMAGGFELPGRPVRLEFSLGATTAPDAVEEVEEGPTDGDGEVGDEEAADEEAGDEEDEPLPLPPGTVLALVRDGTGMLHRVEMGVTDLEETRRVSVDLVARQTGGELIPPVYPLTLVDVEVRTATPTDRPRKLVVELSDVTTIESDGARRHSDLSDQSWNATATTFGFAAAQPSAELSAERSADGVRVDVDTGWSTASLAVVYTIRVGAPVVPQALPAIVTTSWLAESGTAIGDVASVERIRSDPVRVEVVAAVDTAPTVDRGDEAIIVDLATLQVLTAEPGANPAMVTEHWLTLNETSDVLALELAAPPVEAVAVLTERARRSELSSDPTALGIIGALTLGFIAAGVFAMVGFVVMTIVSARERDAEFALLTALGLTLRQLRRTLFVEQAALIAISVFFGTVIGVVLSALVLPLVSLAQDGTPAFPDVVVVYPWRTILALHTLLLAGLLVGSFVTQRLVRRRTIAGALRVGDEG